MKIRILLWVALLAGFYACSKDDDIKMEESFDPLTSDTLWFGHAEGVQGLALKASMAVEVVVPDEAADWCDAEVTGSGSGQSVTVHCVANDKVFLRDFTLVLKTARIERRLVVCQYGVEPVIKVIKSSFELSTDSMILNVPVISTVDYEVLPAESWIHFKEVVKGASVDTLRLGLSASIYPRRNAEVLLKWENLAANISIVQISGDTIYQPQEGTNLAAKVKVVNGETNYESNWRFSKTYDGTSDMYGSGWIPANENLIMTWYFDVAAELGRMEYTPYKDGGINRNLGEFYLFVREEGSSEFKKLGKYDFEHKLTGSSFVFDEELKKVDAVRVEALPPAGNQEQWVLYCQEMEFWAKGFDVTSIFTDEICSGLKDGVTYDQIMAIEDEFYRNIARYMFMGTYDTEFRIQEYKPYINPEMQSMKHKAFAWSFLDNPTGIVVEAGSQVVVMLEDTHDEQISALVVDWNTATYRNLNLNMLSCPLRKGVNVFTADKSGLLYILYNVNDLANRKPVRLHIPSGKVNGYFDISKHDNAYWKTLLSKADFKFLDVKGELSHLVFPTNDYRSYCPDRVDRLVEVYDSIVLLEHQLSGLYKHNRMYPNRILCKVTYEDGYFMYAYNYQTAYHYQTAVPSILKAETLHKDVWGVAHELGHVHQTKDITWRGMTEVSNNVYAMLVQRMFTSESRLLKEDRYQEAYDQIAIPGKPHGIPGEDNPFAKVVPLWQLWLYFVTVADKPDFYMDLYEMMRLESTPRCAQLNFVELCCQVGQIDLTDFFRFYGFLTPINGRVEDSVNPGLLSISQEEIDETEQTIAAMGLTKKAPAIQYLKDNNVALFKNMKPVEAGQVSLSGNKLSLSGWKNVVAWEVYDGSQLVQIAQKDSFDLKMTGSNVTVKAVAANGTKTEVHLP